jgi:hypothetical protein
VHSQGLSEFLLFTLNTQLLYVASDRVGDTSGVMVWFRAEWAKLRAFQEVC